LNLFDKIHLSLHFKTMNMKREEKKSGGKREGAGRKPTTDKIKPIYIGIRESVIKNNGGKDTVKVKCEHFVNNIQAYEYTSET